MKNHIKSSTTFLLLFALMVSTPSNAQHLTQKTNFSFTSKMVSIGDKNFIFTPLGDPIKIGDSSFTTGCYPILINLNDSMQLKNHFCNVDSSAIISRIGNGGWFPDAKMDLEKDIESENLFITGTFSDSSIIFGNDTLYRSSFYHKSIFVAKLDTNLNPIWAINNDYDGDWMIPHIGVKEMAVDGKGRVWLSVKAYKNIAFGKDTVYGNPYERGTVVFDSSGIALPAYYNHPEISNYAFKSMARVGKHKMLLIRENTITPTTTNLIMVDIDADTIIWNKLNSDSIQKIVVDTANKVFYCISRKGILYKYDMMGNNFWHSKFNSNVYCKDISINEHNDKIYVAAIFRGAVSTFGVFDTLNVIYAIDSAGTVIDSTVWGISTDNGNSWNIDVKSFGISSNKLKICYNESNLDTLIFGNDTIVTSQNNGYSLGIISFINLNQLLTSQAQSPALKKSPEMVLELFPNPNKGNFQIKQAENIENIELYNNLGQFVKQLEVSNGNVSIKGDVGIYFLKARYKDGNVAFGKVVKK